MPPIILTGAPGAGKTTLLLELERLGHAVVPEAASDVMALETAKGVERPWENPDFIVKILNLQQDRAARAQKGAIHDRSVLCTLALCRFLGHPVPDALMDAVNDLKARQPLVFFVRLMGFITPTEARRISYAESQRFEAVHFDVYREADLEVIEVLPGGLEQRAAQIMAVLESRSSKEREIRPATG
jgi:predicted ATPase